MRITAYRLEERLARFKAAPGAFQRFVEQLLMADQPDRYHDMLARGRNVANFPTQGWPDVYMFLDDGRYHAIEMTLTSRWKEHLEDDLANAAASGLRLGAFTFVAGVHAPDKDDLKGIENSVAAALGVPRSAIRFLFIEQIIDLLRTPRCARVVADQLGLPTNEFPFETLDAAASVFKGTNAKPLAVTHQEHVDRTVHATHLAAACRSDLQTNRLCFVAGAGAVGKTTLAVTLAIEHERTSGNHSHYLDLAGFDPQKTDAVLEKMTLLAEGRCLFVLDNVHIHPDASRTIIRHWATNENTSSVLALGRQVPDALVDTVEVVTRTRAPVQRLVPDADDLRAVFTRVRGAVRPAASTPTPPMLARWLGTFDGDLVAFSLAVRHVGDKARPFDRLSEHDAVTYVKDTYLRARPAERHNLCMISAFAGLELAAPEETLDEHGIAGAEAQGTVLRADAADRYARYRLALWSVGRLVLAAESADPNHGTSLLHRAVERYPFIAHPIAGRLENAGDQKGACAILALLSADRTALFEGILAVAPSQARRHLERLERLGVLTFPEIGDHLAGRIDELVGLALRNPVAELPAFARFTRAVMPAVGDAFVGELAAPQNAAALVAATRCRNLREIFTFLQFAGEAMPQVAMAVTAALAEPDAVAELVYTAEQGNLADIVLFLRFADAQMPEIARLLADGLSTPETTSRVAVAAAARNLTDIPEFLAFARTALPGLVDGFTEQLADQHVVPLLVETALARRLGGLTSFLGDAGGPPAAVKALLTALDEPANAERLAAHALAGNLGEMSAFLAATRTELPAVTRHLVGRLSDAAAMPRLAEAAAARSLTEVVALVRFTRAELPPAATTALAAELSRPERRAQLAALVLGRSLWDVPSCLGALRKALPAVAATLVEALADPANAGLLVDAALTGTLREIQDILVFARAELPALAASLASELAAPAHAGRLAETALAGDLDTIASFLAFTRRSLRAAPGAPTVADRLVERLGDPGSIRRAAQVGATRSLGQIAGFLRFALAELPADSVASFAAELGCADRLARIIDLALTGSNGETARLLNDTRVALPSLADALAAGICDPANVVRLRRVAATGNFEELLGLLKALDERWPHLRLHLERLLDDEPTLRAVVGKFAELPTDQARKALRHSHLPPAFVRGISTDDWDPAGRACRDADLWPLSEAAACWSDLGRPDLAAASAAEVMETVCAEGGPRPGYYIYHATDILHAVAATPSEESGWRFFSAVSTPQWMEEQIRRADISTLSRALFDLRVRLGPRVRDRVPLPALQHWLRYRVLLLLRRAASFGAADMASFIGVLSLYGALLPPGTLHDTRLMLTPALLESVLDPMPPGHAVRYALGLRALSRATGAPGALLHQAQAGVLRDRCREADPSIGGALRAEMDDLTLWLGAISSVSGGGCRTARA